MPPAPHSTHSPTGLFSNLPFLTYYLFVCNFAKSFANTLIMVCRARTLYILTSHAHFYPCSLHPQFPYDHDHPLRALARTPHGPLLHNRKCFRVMLMWTLYLINVHTALPHPLPCFPELPCPLQTIGGYTKEYTNTRPFTPFILVQHAWLFEQQMYTLPCHSGYVSQSPHLREPWTALINSRYSVPNGCWHAGYATSTHCPTLVDPDSVYGIVVSNLLIRARYPASCLPPRS